MKNINLIWIILHPDSRSFDPIRRPISFSNFGSHSWSLQENFDHRRTWLGSFACSLATRPKSTRKDPEKKNKNYALQ